MAESFKSIYDKRACFQKNRQRDFLITVEKTTKKTAKELAELVSAHPRTVREWKKEKHSMPLRSLKILCRISGVNMPPNIMIQKPLWWTKQAGVRGGVRTYKKYGVIGGDQKKRVQKWRHWWDTIGQFKKANTKILQRKTIKKPKPSGALAEFIGIVLGDGGITKRQITISLHHINDKEYAIFVRSLMKKLFAVSPKLYHYATKSINTLVFSRTDLVDFCTKKLGLKIGNKIRHQIDIPNWIRNNKKYSIACLRGLMDTDGTVIIHTYRVNGKQYTYKKLGFTSRSAPLLKSVSRILARLSIKHRYSGSYDIRIESKAGIETYFTHVGSHNPKHLKRYRK